MKKVLKNRKIYMLSFVLLLLVGIITLIITSIYPKKLNSKFMAYTDNYESNLNPIAIDGLANPNGDEFYSISNFSSNWDGQDTNFTVTIPSDFNDANYKLKTGDNKKYISISDDKELAIFSRLCNPDLNEADDNYQKFLGYNYILTENITGGSISFIPVGVEKNHPFTGEFNGNGYDIENITFFRMNEVADLSNYSVTVSSMNYFAMFSYNSGLITKFGLINANLNMNYASKSSFNSVAAVCGSNSGTIEYVFVRDLRDISLNQSGLMPFGGYIISGFVFQNEENGKINNCYIAYNTIVNGSVDDYNDFTETIYENKAEAKVIDNVKVEPINNLYFYNSAITSISPAVTDNKYKGEKATISYESLNMSAKRNVYGTYCTTIDNLNSKIYDLNDSKWYNARTYETYSDDKDSVYKLFDSYMPTPILRGITYSKTDKKFDINNEKDYAIMYELFNHSDSFASANFTYQIKGNIRLDLLKPSRYSYSRAIASTIIGIEGDYNLTPIFGETNKSNYPTILYPNFDKRFAAVEGFYSYGLFPYFTGTIKNLNVIAKRLDDNATALNVNLSNGVNAFGVLIGFGDSATIENINIYENLTFDSKNSNNEAQASKAFIGGAFGVLTGKGSIKTITTAGSMTNNISVASGDVTGYVKGNTTSGVVGCTDYTGYNFDDILNTIDITVIGVNDIDNSVGGILGSGYTLIAKNLQNEGNIIVGSDSTSTANFYVAGVIGKHLGMMEELVNITNFGDINLNNAANAYITGVINAIPQLDLENSYQEIGSYYELGKYQYWASSVTNAANINVNKVITNLYYSSVFNVITTSTISGNSCYTKLSGIYNLSYRKPQRTGLEEKLVSQTVKIENAYKYTPIFNYNHNQTSEALLSTVYNLRDIDFTLGTTIAASKAVTLNYSGVSLGSDINYYNVRNEGNLTYDFKESSKITTASTLKVSGVFEILSDDYSASSVFNNGNITITDSADNDLKLNIYVSGICYENQANISAASQNPLNQSFDKTLVGNLNNVINNGNILVTSSDYDKDMVASKTNNENKPVEASQTSTTNLVGNVYASGIVYINRGIVSNTFNLGDVELDIFAKDNNNFYIGGIACILDGENAQIRDSANNGTLQNINMCNTKNRTAKVLVGGIFATNVSGHKDDNINKNKDNINQVVAFTINYGTLICFDGKLNVADRTFGTFCSLVGGISAKGICNIVNVLNYGNIYGSEATGSIVGAFDLSDTYYNSNNTVNLANTINYGTVYELSKYKYSGSTLDHASFNSISELDEKYINSGEYNSGAGNYYYLGSMFGYIDYNSKTNINVRYVINFFKGAYITQSINQKNAPTDNAAIDTSTFITVNGSLDTFGGSSVAYAPLSTIEDKAGNIGVFSEKFIFRRAINGDSEAVDSSIVTDSYIADFFQFVRFDKVNDVLLEKIGWKNIAYLNAADQLAKDVHTMAVFVTYDDLTRTTDSVKPSFESTTWYANIDTTLLTNFLKEALSNDDDKLIDFSSDDLKKILKEILFGNAYASDITIAIRKSIVDTIIDYYDEISSTDYSTLLQKLLYDEVLAKVVSNEDTNYKAVQDKIKTIINSSNQVDLEKVLDNYLNLLLEDTNNEILTPLFVEDEHDDYSFENDLYVQNKVNLIKNLLNGYDDSTLTTMVKELLEGVETAADSLKYQSFLNNNPSEAIEIYSNIIAANSFRGNTQFLDAINKSLTKYYDDSLLEEYDGSNIVNEFPTSNLPEKPSNVVDYDLDDNNNIDYNYSWINGKKWQYTHNYTELWNLIKNNSTFQNYLLSDKTYFNNVQDPTNSNWYTSIIAKATEWNNTYQSNDGPSKITETDLTENKIYRDTGYTDNGKTYQWSKYKAYAGENVPSPLDAGGSNNNIYYEHNGGVFRNKNGSAGYNQKIENRFIYVPDSYNSYATYYYGPFMATGKVFASKFTANYTYLGYDIYNASSSANKTYVPAFISTNETIVRNAIDNSDTTATNKTINTFYYNNFGKVDEGNGKTNFKSDSASSRYQWVSKYIIDKDKGKGDGANYLYKNYTDSEWVVDYYDFDPDREITWDTDLNYENTTIQYEGNDIQLNLSSRNQHTKADPYAGKGGITHPLREYYLEGHATSAIITGIWFVHSVWYDGGIIGCYLMGKETGVNGSRTDRPAVADYNGYNGINTTQYTYYQMKDLLRLDGIQTKGKRDGREDADEIGIISAIMEKVLSTDNGKKAVLKALGEYSKNNNFTSSQSASAKYLASALIGTSFAKDAVTNVIVQQSSDALTNEKYSINTALKDYLDSLIRGIDFDPDDELAMAGATNKDIFKKILLAVFTADRYDDDLGTNTITGKDLTYFIYKYATYLKSQDENITDDVVANALASVKDSDLETFNTLSYLDWDEYIPVIGGDADASQEDGIGSYTVIKDLYDSLGGSDGADIGKGFAYPFKIASNELIEPESSEINMNLAAGSKPVSACTTLAASTSGNNIGYYVGSDIKVYRKSNAPDYSEFYYPNNDGEPYQLPYGNYPAPSSDIVEYLTSTAVVEKDDRGRDVTYRYGDYLIRLTGTSQLDSNNEGGLVVVPNAVVGNWTGNLLVPNRCIWVAPVQEGTFRFVLSNINNDKKMGFRLYKLTRSNPGHYDSYFSANTTAIECNMQLFAGKSYYYEINITQDDIEAGYEYAIATGDGYMPYVSYIDIGANGSDSAKVEYPDLKDIEYNYSNYYSNLSNYGNYLITESSEMINTYPTNTTSITVTEPTFLLIKASSGGKVTVSGTTTYLVDDTTTTISNISKNTDNSYRAYYLSGGTYTISSTDTTILDIITVERDNSLISTGTDTTTITYTNGSDSKVVFEGANYTDLKSFNLDIDLTDEIKEVLSVVYPSMITTIGPNNKEYYFFNDATKGDSDIINLFNKNDNDKKEIIKLLAYADYYDDKDSVLAKLIDNLDSKYYDNVLLNINDDDVRENILTQIISMVNKEIEEDENSPKFKNTETLIIAAYLGQDYLNYSSAKQLTKTKLYTLLNGDSGYLRGQYNFIEDDSTINAETFDEFLKHLGSSSNLKGYGIFALASSQGIKNGDFIPDNLKLGDMDVKYIHDDGIVKLLPGTNPSSNWRIYGNTRVSTYYPGDNSTEYAESVNYAFFIEMKQLKLAIATTIFELDLVTSISSMAGVEYNMYSSNDLIEYNDEENSVIKYYVPSNYLTQIIAEKDLTVEKLVKSNTATVYYPYGGAGSDSEVIIDTENSNNISFDNDKFKSCADTDRYKEYSDSYVFVNAIKVVAEDKYVVEYYDLLLIPIDYTFSAIYDATENNGSNCELSENNTKATVSAKDGVVVIKINSPKYTKVTGISSFDSNTIYYKYVDSKYVEVDKTTETASDNTEYFIVFTRATEKIYLPNKTYYSEEFVKESIMVGTSVEGIHYVSIKANQLPKGLDLEPYITIGKKTDSSMGPAINKAFTLSDNKGDHVVDKDGNAIITMNINTSLPQGEYFINIGLYGNNERLILVKEPNHDVKFELVYNGDTIINSTTKEFTSRPLWGTQYVYSELKSLTYADSYTIAENATMEVTVDYKLEPRNNTNVTYDLAKYIIKIKVIAEDGTTNELYTHTLREKDPYKDDDGKANPSFASIYKDGATLDGIAKYDAYVNPGEYKDNVYTVDMSEDKIHINYLSTYDSNGKISSCNTSKGDNIVRVYFSRDDGTPNYRIKYSFTNIYYSNDDKKYSTNLYKDEVLLDSNTKEITTHNVDSKVMYAGLNVYLNDLCDTGEYDFSYVYTTASYLSDYYEKVGTEYVRTEDITALSTKTYYELTSLGEYVQATISVGTELSKIRKLEFPKLRVVKTASLNALIYSTTFIQRYEALGSLATLVYPDYSIVPTDQNNSRDPKEPVYDHLLSQTQLINVDAATREINYDDYATKSSDYYIVGTTSDAKLENYVPLYILQDKYAKVFQFVSPTKQNDYTGGTNYTDFSILGDHGDNFVYLNVKFNEYNKSGDDWVKSDVSVIYLVRVNLKDMTYTTVFNKDGKGYPTGNSLGTLTASLKSNSISITVKGSVIYDNSYNVYFGNDTTRYYVDMDDFGSVQSQTLYANYSLATTNNRFWYYSYVVFSEDFLQNGLGTEPADATDSDWNNRVKFYHVAVIDISNNIKFVFEVDAPIGFEALLDSIYVTLSYNKYTSGILNESKQLSLYAEHRDKLYIYDESLEKYKEVDAPTVSDGTQYYFYDQTTKDYYAVNWTTTALSTFTCDYALQVLPTAYYTFSLDLPAGYKVSYIPQEGKENRNEGLAGEENAYLPPSSIVTQTIKVVIKIEEDETQSGGTWGITTSTVSTVIATPKN